VTATPVQNHSLDETPITLSLLKKTGGIKSSALCEALPFTSTLPLPDILHPVSNLRHPTSDLRFTT